MTAQRLFILLICLLNLFIPGRGECALDSRVKGKTQLEIILGRVCVVVPDERSGGINLKSFGNPQLLLQVVRDINGMATVSYRYNEKNNFGRMEVQAGSYIQNFWANRNENRYIKFTQLGNAGDITLEKGEIPPQMWMYLKESFERPIDWEKLSIKEATTETKIQTWRAKSIWELLFFQTPECYQALQILWMPLTGDMEILAQLRREFIAALIQNDQKMNGADGKTLLELEKSAMDLIRALDNDDFMTRHLADQKLRRAEPMMVFLLRNRLNTELSPEAKLRLSQILETHGEIGTWSREMYFWDAHFWLNSGKMWASVLRFGSKEQREYAWNVLQKRFLPSETLNELKYDPKQEANAQEDVLQKILDSVKKRN